MLVGDQRIGKALANALDRAQALCLVASGEYDNGTGARQRHRRLVAEAARRSGHDGSLAAEGGDVCRGPVGHAIAPSGLGKAPRRV